MSVTKEQWAAVKETLKGLYFDVKFRLQTGEEITVNKRFIAENKMALVVWIDGERNPGWGFQNLDTFRPVVKQVWHRKTFRPAAKEVRRISALKGGKAYLKRKENQYLHKVVEYWECTFSTAAALVRQFSKIDSIELVEGVKDEK